MEFLSGIGVLSGYMKCKKVGMQPEKEGLMSQRLNETTETKRVCVLPTTIQATEELTCV